MKHRYLLQCKGVALKEVAAGVLSTRAQYQPWPFQNDSAPHGEPYRLSM